MKTKKAMQQTGVRYWSQLSPKQQDVATWAILRHAETKKGKEHAFLLWQNLHERMKGERVFLYNGVFFPLNIGRITQ